MATEPVTRRLLPVIPSVALDLPAQLRIFGPGKGGRQQELLIRRPTAIDGELTIDMASVLNVTVEDPHFELFRNSLLRERLTLSLGSIPEVRYISGWVMDVGRGVGGRGRDGTATVITFWGLGEAALKSRTAKGRTWPAGKLNFEGWARALLADVEQDVDLRAVVPRPNSSPPRETDSTSSRSSSVSGSDGSSGSLGFSTETAKKITVKGAPASPAQLRLIDRVLRHCVKKKYPARAVWSMCTANIGEAEYDEEATNPTSGAKGLFQLMPPPGWQARLDYKDIEANIDVFMGPGFAASGGAVKLCKENPSMSPGTVASKVEGSDQGGRFYDPFAGEARTMIELWSGVTLDRWESVTGPAGTSDPRDEASSSSQRPTSWRIGTTDEAESYWTGLGRTCQGLGRRRFVSALRLVAARDQDLILAAPHMSITLDDPVIAEPPNINVRGNAKLQTVSLRVFAAGWSAPHGSVVDLRAGGFRVDGPWLVRSIGFRAGDPIIDVELAQPTTKIPSGGGSSTKNSATIAEGAAAAISWAEARVGIRETGFNTGPEVSPLITEQGGQPGQAWCGYFCRGALRAAGLEAPVQMASVQWIYDTSGSRASVFRGRTTPAHAKPGDLAVFGTGRHVGLITRVNVSRQEIETIEGNTSLPDGGQGAARKTHAFRQVTAIAQVDYGTNRDRSETRSRASSLPITAATA